MSAEVWDVDELRAAFDESVEGHSAWKRKWALVQGWLDRGDGVAVYENVALDSSHLGTRYYVSFGSAAAQFANMDASDLPDPFPDTPRRLNWAYRLKAVVLRAEDVLTSTEAAIVADVLKENP